MENMLGNTGSKPYCFLKKRSVKKGELTDKPIIFAYQTEKFTNYFESKTAQG